MRPPSPWTMASLAAASWETISRRAALMAKGACSPAEYRRMVTEKVEATRAAATALIGGKSGNAVVAPYVKAAKANAKRLRRK